MKKETLKRIFDRLETEYQRDKELDKAVKSLLNILSPSQYPLFIENSHFTGMLKGIEILNEDLHNDIYYYFYEVKDWDIKEVIVTDKNGKEYNAKNLDEYIDFIINNNKK